MSLCSTRWYPEKVPFEPLALPLSLSLSLSLSLFRELSAAFETANKLGKQARNHGDTTDKRAYFSAYSACACVCLFVWRSACFLFLLCGLCKALCRAVEVVVDTVVVVAVVGAAAVVAVVAVVVVVVVVVAAAAVALALLLLLPPLHLQLQCARLAQCGETEGSQAVAEAARSRVVWAHCEQLPEGAEHCETFPPLPLLSVSA